MPNKQIEMFRPDITRTSKQFLSNGPYRPYIVYFMYKAYKVLCRRMTSWDDFKWNCLVFSITRLEDGDSCFHRCPRPPKRPLEEGGCQYCFLGSARQISCREALSKGSVDPTVTRSAPWGWHVCSHLATRNYWNFFSWAKKFEICITFDADISNTN